MLVDPLFLPVAFALLALLSAALLVLLAYRLGRRSGRAAAERDFPRLLAGEREDAVRRSRAVLGGLAAEQLAPWLPGFPWDPTELRFIGKPVDFVVFKGASRGEVEELVFVEVKTGSAGLSRVERSLREAVRAGKVSWQEWRPAAVGESAPPPPPPGGRG